MKSLIIISLFFLSIPLYANTRLISTSPVITEIIGALEATSSLVGVTSHCNYPDSVKTLPKIGDQTLNIEKIISLNPDLVIGLDNNPFYNNQLARLGIETLFLSSPQTISGIYTLIQTIGHAIERDQEASALVKKLKQNLAKISHQNNKKKPKVLFVLWYPPLTAIGSQTFISDMITAAGGTNAIQKTKSDYPTLNLETVITLNPDCLILSHQDFDQVIRRHPAILETTAGKHNQIYLIPNTDLIARSGPRFIEGILTLQVILDQVKIIE